MCLVGVILFDQVHQRRYNHGYVRHAVLFTPQNVEETTDGNRVMIAHVWIDQHVHKLVDCHRRVLMLFGEVQLLNGDQTILLLLLLDLDFWLLVVFGILLVLYLTSVIHAAVIFIESEHLGHP